MLSGLTSQLGTLIGTKSKDTTTTSGTNDAGEPGTNLIQDSTIADGGTGVEGSAGPASSPPAEQAQTGVLTSVRNHIPSWLTGGKFLGGKDESATAKDDVPGGKGSSAGGPPTGGDVSPSKESDASSATGGADSDNQISEGEGEATGDKAIGLEKVKNLGNFLFSTIKGAGQKIKDTNILSEFQREHDSFLKSKMGKTEAIPPWIGHPKEEALKEEILSLSSDRRNFVRSPPSGVSFTWDWEEMAPVARAILKEDPNLETMRYELVPKVITEEHFWRNYFYRVSLLKESMSEDEPKSGKTTSGTTTTTSSRSNRDKVVGSDVDDDDEIEKELNEELRSFEVVGGESGVVGLGGGDDADDKEIEALLDLK